MKAETYEKIITVDDYLDKYCDIELFQEKCALCPVYGWSWSCPPFDSFDTLRYWKSFHSLILVCRKLIMTDKDKADYRKAVAEKFVNDKPKADDWRSESGKMAVKGEIKSGGDGDKFNINKLIDGNLAGLLEQLVSLEKIYPGSNALIPGSCIVCGYGNCARKLGKPCRHPEKMHHSLESLGSDLDKTTRELFGIEMKWIVDNELPDYFVQIGGLLIKE
ncbi:MAG: hypothetical protein IKF07_07355 [Eubacterium sp.]|nr:hypothetical protein [Eubacterium sp.]